MKVALPTSPFNRRDLFEEAGFEVVEGPIRSTEEFIELVVPGRGYAFIAPGQIAEYSLRK